MPEKLNEQTAKTALPASGRNTIKYDTELRGFGLRITKTGTRSFLLSYSINGRERRITIGRWPDWSVAAAREEAKKLRRLIDQGIDPLAKRRDDRTAKTVNDLWLQYESDYLPKLATRAQADVRSMWQKRLLPPLQSVKLRDLTSAQIDRLHRQISADHPVRANRVLEAFRRALNLAVRWGWIDRNPAQGFQANPEHPKDTYLTSEQLERILDCLDRLPNAAAANVIRLLIFTGARVGEVLKAEWSQFDLTAGIWTKPPANTKQRKLHRVPLSACALAVLQEMEKTRDSSPYLFPGSNGNPIGDIRYSWSWVRGQLGLQGVRIHDLRHSFASLLISTGETLPVIGRLLGHSQNQTTMRYAHLADSPLRAAADRLGALVHGNLSDKSPSEELADAPDETPTT
jgi:integrase